MKSGRRTESADHAVKSEVVVRNDLLVGAANAPNLVNEGN